jgi:phosphoribulokinase
MPVNHPIIPVTGSSGAGTTAVKHTCPWEPLPQGSDLLFYEGLHGAAVTDKVNVARDYVNYICPQFTQTGIDFRRVPVAGTSNPFIALWIPAPDESMVVIRFRDPRGIDFSYLVKMIYDSFMSRANSIVIPGGKLGLAIQLILALAIARLIELKRRAS